MTIFECTRNAESKATSVNTFLLLHYALKVLFGIYWKAKIDIDGD
jgi:hypothetical protein